MLFAAYQGASYDGPCGATNSSTYWRSNTGPYSYCISPAGIPDYVWLGDEQLVFTRFVPGRPDPRMFVPPAFCKC